MAPAVLGFAGLIPPAAAAVGLLVLPVAVQPVTWVVLIFYAALIFSFLGGIWWAFAAMRDPRPRWLLMAVAPSLVALVLLVMMLGAATRMAAAALLAIAILASPLADQALAAAGLTPAWWLRLRVPLSVGLALCVAVAAARVPGG